MTNIKAKLERFLTIWDGIWSVPLGVLAFVGCLYVGESIFGQGFGGFSPGYLHALLFASVALMLLNTVAQLGIKFNFPAIWHFLIGKAWDRNQPETLLEDAFTSLPAIQRVIVAIATYFMYLILGIWLVSLLLGGSVAAAPVVPIKSIHASSDCLPRTYLSQVGVREATNHNDGEQVETYLRSCGLGRGYAWCAAFVKWTLVSCGIPCPSITAWAATTFNPQQVVYQRGRLLRPLAAGDVFQLWDYRYGRVAHTGFIHGSHAGGTVETVEGNTNGGGSADGDGVYRRGRALKSLYAVSRW